MKGFMFLTMALLVGCSLGGAKEQLTEEQLVRKRYKETCIGGHIYYVGYSKMAIRLNDEGKPIKCAFSKSGN